MLQPMYINAQDVQPGDRMAGRPSDRFDTVKKVVRREDGRIEIHWRTMAVTYYSLYWPKEGVAVWRPEPRTVTRRLNGDITITEPMPGRGK